MKPISSLLVACAAAMVIGAAPSEPEKTSEVVTGNTSSEFTVVSKDFADGANIPVEHTCDGADRSPALSWSGAPEESKAFAIVMEDPDAKGFTHWTAWNVPKGARALDRGVPVKAELGDGTIQGKNDFGRVGYAGPCPPKGPAHQYVIRVFALDGPLEIDDGAAPDDVIAAAKKKSLADAKLKGTYQRSTDESAEKNEETESDDR
jgi:Raf kinase inhibitor-like YbhB/YbcL family protein